MNEGDYVVYGKWLGDGYAEFVGYLRSGPSGPDEKISLTAYDNAGGSQRASVVKSQENAANGEDYWRAYTPPALNGGKALAGQAVFVSVAREEDDSDIFRGLIVGAPVTYQANLEIALRVLYYDTRRNRDRTRTFIPAAHAGPCDNFWSEVQPEPTFCED